MTRWAVPGLVPIRWMGEDRVGRRVVARRRWNLRSLSVTYLSEEFLADSEFRNRFVVDAQELAHLRHPAVARVHRYVECPEGAAVIADHVEGTRLRSLLMEEGAIATEAALVVLTDALRGLAACHAMGLAHGDLKPEVVMLTRAGRVRLVDVGLFTEEGRRLLVRSTPFYLAPEQWAGGPATPAADLYAAAVTFFECLAGAPPFHADNPAMLFTRHEHGAACLDEVPASMRQLVRCGLAKDPAGRPGSARDLVARVERAAVEDLGPGWERRGRRELSRLLTGASRPPVVERPQENPAQERHFRFAAVLGGALVLAAGLSNPPVPSVLPPGGSDGASDTDGGSRSGSPLPETAPGTVEAWVDARDAVADPTRGSRSAAMAEPVGPFVPNRSEPVATATVPPTGLTLDGDTWSSRMVPPAPAPSRGTAPSSSAPNPRTSPSESPEPTAPRETPRPRETTPGSGESTTPREAPESRVLSDPGPGEDESGTDGGPGAPEQEPPAPQDGPQDGPVAPRETSAPDAEQEPAAPQEPSGRAAPPTGPTPSPESEFAVPPQQGSSPSRQRDPDRRDSTSTAGGLDAGGRSAPRSGPPI